MSDSGVKLGPNQKNLFNIVDDTTDQIIESATKKFMTAAEKSQLVTNTSDISTIKTNFFDKTTDKSNDIFMSVGTYRLQAFLDLLIGRGHVSGCMYTDNGNGTATYSNGESNLKTASTPGSTGGIFNVTGATLTFVDNDRNFVYANYNSGSPIVATTTTLGNIITKIGRAHV